MNGIKLERVAPNQEQVALQQDIPYKVKYRCKCCEMLWLDKLALFSRFQLFFRFVALKHSQKWCLKLQIIGLGTNQSKANGLAKPPGVCVESEIWMKNL